VTSRHLVWRSAEAAYTAPAELAGHCDRLVRWALVGEHNGAVHTGFALCELEAGGSVGAHVHSYEESVFVLTGEVALTTAEGTSRLRAGDYALLPVGMAHALHGLAPARWAEQQAPQPRSRAGYDTVFVPPLATDAARPGLDVRDPRTRSFGHIEPAAMDPGKQEQDQLLVSASMRTALLVYSGISVKMMVDSDLGAQLSTMFMVQYEPGGLAGTHDHPFEEAYLVLDGEVDSEFDGERYRLAAGDGAWAGVGCVHGFSNAAGVPVRWLETQAPQPPARHSYRFTRDWDYLAGLLGRRPD
jgi:quercetin dioxygenase-like cupin family protein